jgi:hypothetical protein
MYSGYVSCVDFTHVLWLLMYILQYLETMSYNRIKSHVRCALDGKIRIHELHREHEQNHIRYKR